MTGDSKFSEVVEFSDEDQCYIGYCPGIIGPCCHGDDVNEVRRELRQIVDEWLEIEREDNARPRASLQESASE